MMTMGTLPNTTAREPGIKGLELGPQRVLIIEDEPHIADLIELTLKPLGLIMAKAHNLQEAKERLTREAFDLILADWMLPDFSGTEIIAFVKNREASATATAAAQVAGAEAGAVKAQPFASQVMMVTAKGDAASIVHALDLGADDFLVKPFEPDVLVARVQNLLRRSALLKTLVRTQAPVQAEIVEADVLEHHGLEMNFARVEVKLNAQLISLTLSEFKLLGQLLKSKGKVLTRESLIEKIQGHDVNVTNRTIDTHVFALRKKLGDWSNYIETIRGVGYRIHF